MLFFPPLWTPIIDASLSDLEVEALLLMIKLGENDIRKLLAQIRTLVTLKQE